MMAMEVHGAPGHDMDHFIRSRLFHNRDHEVIYPCPFAFNFLGNILLLLFNVF
jgi:hypothetical protein